MKMKMKITKRKKKTIKDGSTPQITNETVAEHREDVISKGRRFKYPHQYLKHKLIFNALILTFVAVSLLSVFIWFQLYIAQNSSSLLYRITKVVPVPVASVDNSTVTYGDYLMRYRSQEYWLKNNGQLGLNEKDKTEQLSYFKRKVLDDLEKDIFAQRLAKEQGITVNDDEIDDLIYSSMVTSNGKISKAVFDAASKETLGYSPDEYRHLIHQTLVRFKVTYAIDNDAKLLSNKVGQLLNTKDIRKSSNPLSKIATYLSKDGVQYGESGLVPDSNRDGGLAKTAKTLKDGEISAVIQATDISGLYFVQRVSADGNRVNYRFLHVPVNEFKKKFSELKNSGKIKEYIQIRDISKDK